MPRHLQIWPCPETPPRPGERRAPFPAVVREEPTPKSSSDENGAGT